MFDLFCWEDALQCVFSGESWYVAGEIVCVGYEARLVILGLGALVSGTDDIP